MAKKGKLKQLVVENNTEVLEELYPYTSADIVSVNNSSGHYGGAKTNVQEALEEVYTMASTGGVTGVKGNAEQSYRNGNVNLTPANIGAVPASDVGYLDLTSHVGSQLTDAEYAEVSKKYCIITHTGRYYYKITNQDSNSNYIYFNTIEDKNLTDDDNITTCIDTILIRKNTKVYTFYTSNDITLANVDYVDNALLTKVDKSDIGYVEISANSGTFIEAQIAEIRKKYCIIKSSRYDYGGIYYKDKYEGTDNNFTSSFVKVGLNSQSSDTSLMEIGTLSIYIQYNPEQNINSYTVTSKSTEVYRKNALDTILSGKQPTLSTQTAYTSKGTSTKVPQITTNTLGQVTGVTEVDIAFPTPNNGTLTMQVNGTQKATFTANQSGNTTFNITAADLGVSGALRFIGTTTSNISDGSTTNPIVIDSSNVTASSGNVVLKGNKEFLWTGSAWEELGDESSHALKTVSITGTGVLGGGGTLESNRTITHNEVLGTAKTTAGVYKVKIDKYGHISEATSASASDVGAQASFTDGSATIASKSGDVVTIKAGVSQSGGKIANNSNSDITLGSSAVKSYTTSVTSGSGSLVTSGGVYTALSAKATAVSTGQGSWSSVTVNSEGIVTDGGTMIEVGSKSGTNTPSNKLAIGGLFFEEI